jgi:hypothetical protein
MTPWPPNGLLKSSKYIWDTLYALSEIISSNHVPLTILREQLYRGRKNEWYIILHLSMSCSIELDKKKMVLFPYLSSWMVFSLPQKKSLMTKQIRLIPSYFSLSPLLIPSRANFDPSNQSRPNTICWTRI